MSFSLFLDAAAKGIKDRGKAEIGDKTMLDVWMPAAEEMKKQANSGANLMDALDSTVKNARNAMNKTKDLTLQKKVESSKLRETKYWSH